MDGLLIDSEPLWFEVARSFVNDRSGHVLTAEHGRACVGKGIASSLGFLRETFGIDVDIARDTRELVDRFIDRIGGLSLKPGAADLLAAARGRLPLALASSSSPRLISAALAHFEIAPFFDAVISGESVPRTKPAPDIFLRAASDLGVPAAACVVLEDSLPGVTAGRAAGMIVLAVPEGPPDGRGFEELADAVLPDLAAARAWLNL